ncbi:hypothetical protein OHV10_21520 [Vibrio splendidus]|uniref:hypothetical protein n=1 Tax=Vibrio splendidus TaxID=29497 RepID=UPI0022365BEE|nr:hypothetical protein [Vibrio splendidus]MCW4446823.1 hypothetical protein [Vibrio splendidus]
MMDMFTGGGGLSSAATMGDTKSGGDSTSSFSTGNMNMGGGGISNQTLLIMSAVAIGLLLVLKK